MIEVRMVSDADPYGFEVAVREGGTATRHRVTMSHGTYETLGAGRVNPEQAIDAAFRYLLEREPKESILTSFDLTLISRYFPGFERGITSYL